MKGHEFVVEKGTHGQTIRVCTHCGMTHMWVSEGLNGRAGWEPVDEYKFTKDGGWERSDLPGCDADVPARPEKSLPDKAANLCYCRNCEGRSPHYEGATKCHCQRCNGKRVHNG